MSQVREFSKVLLRLDSKSAVQHNKWQPQVWTCTISSPSLTVPSFALWPHLSHLHRCGRLPNSPYQDPSFSPWIVQKNRGTKIIWTKGRDALGLGLQPRCQRAKTADCPSLSTISICLQLCISWGQSGGARRVCKSLWTKLHIYHKAKTKSEAENNQNNAQCFLMALDETSLEEQFCCTIITGKKRDTKP